MMYVLIAVSVVFAVLIILTVAANAVLNSAGFSKRCEGNENLKYLKAKNFDNLNARPISFKSDKNQTLNGFIYSGAKTDKYKALIIFSHGMGAGHLSYTTEINYFAQKGYLVLAYDNTGTCSSEGKKLYGFAQGVIDLNSAIRFASSRDDIKELPILLMGHSWGGYSVCNAPALASDVDIRGIVAFSPFNSVNRLISDIAKLKLKIGLSFLHPFFDAVNFFRFGKNGLLKSCTTIASNEIPTLILHGGNDMASKYKKQSRRTKKPNFRKSKCKNSALRKQIP